MTETTYSMELRFARREHLFSQKELAKRVGVSPSTVCKYEKGDKHPSIKIAKKIEKILGVKPRCSLCGRTL